MGYSVEQNTFLVPLVSNYIQQLSSVSFSTASSGSLRSSVFIPHFQLSSGSISGYLNTGSNFSLTISVF